MDVDFFKKKLKLNTRNFRYSIGQFHCDVTKLDNELFDQKRNTIVTLRFSQTVRFILSSYTRTRLNLSPTMHESFVVDVVTFRLLVKSVNSEG